MKTRTTLVAAVAALALVGGGTAYALTSTQEPVPVETVASSPSPTESATPTPPTSETEKPLAVESPDATPSPNDLFLADIHDRLTGLGAATTIPNATDDQLIAAGHAACDALTSGTPFDDVSVIDGETRVQGSYLDSAAIATSGVLFYCSELNGNLR